MDEIKPDNPSNGQSIASTKEKRGLHGPSIGIGAGIAIVSILATFFVINIIDNNPELKFEEKSPTQDAKEVTLSLFTSNASPYLGSENAPITLVEFGDYQCFYCNKFYHETEGSILKNYIETGKVKMIFKDFTIIGPDSVAAAHASHCANEQGKFWEYHDTLYNNWAGENNGWASLDNLTKFANYIQLDQETFVKCMSDGKYQQQITANNNDARTLGLTGTPGFFVIGPDNQITKLNGAQPYNVFESLFESVLPK
jgi:protein-disulfide isomerase